MKRNFMQALLKSVVCISLTLSSCTLFANHLSGLSVSSGFFFLDTLIQPNDTTVFLTCEDSVTVCIGVPFQVINNYQIFTNGGVYASGITGCDYDTVSVYRYELLTGQGNSGPYILQSWRINGVLYTSAFNNISQLVDSLNIWDPSGNWVDNTLSRQIRGGNPANVYTDMIIFEIIPGAPRTLPKESGVVANATQIKLPSNKNEIVVREISTSRSDTFDLWTACVNPSVSSVALTEGDSISRCIDLSELMTDVSRVIKVESPTNGVVDFNLMNNDSCLSIKAMGQGLDTAYVVVCDDLDICDTSWFFASVSPPLGFRIVDLDAYVNESNTVCYDMAALGGTADAIYNICPESSGTYASFSLDTINYCVNIDAMNAGGTDTACIVVCNMGVCDTIQYNVRVYRRGPENVNRTVYMNQTDTYCEFALPNLNGPVDTMINYCEQPSPENVDFSLDIGSLCVDYSGLSLGSDTACVVVFDTNGDSDTTLLIVNTISPITDTIFITLNYNDRIDLCLDTSELGAPVDTAFFCTNPTDNAIIADTNLVGLCISVVAGTTMGLDTICMVVCDDSLVCDTTIYYITVIDPSILPRATADLAITQTNNPVVINILGNDTIPGSPLDRVLRIIVDPANGTYFDNNDGTITYTPDSDFCGTDQLSYEICNAIGCDTADVVITINCDSNSITDAVDDVATTTLNNNVTIDILGNDNIPGDPVDWTYFVIDPNFGGSGPNHGSYLDNMDGTVTYIPDSAFCNGTDSFNYVVCSGSSNCDTAIVTIAISCTSDTASIKVFNAFSPNNDGNNDCFFVEGIENLRDNTVYIYNRWGNLVYQAINYDNQNDCWDGTWKGNALPDGTYFYVIEGGSSTKVSGYVVIHR